MTAVYERCGENIRSSRRSSATVNFRSPLFRAGKAEKTAGGSRPVQGVQRASMRRARLTTRLFHSFAGRTRNTEMTPACFATSTMFGFGGIYDVAWRTEIYVENETSMWLKDDSREKKGRKLISFLPVICKMKELKRNEYDEYN